MSSYYQEIKSLFGDYLRCCFGKRKRHLTYKPSTVWDPLASENRQDLMTLLTHIERKDAGYSTVLIPDGGFSTSTTTHKAIIRFLKYHKVNFYNVKNEVRHLEAALHQ